MFLTELTGIKKLSVKSAKGIIVWLKREFLTGGSRLRVLGHGANGFALTNGKTVFKFWARDSAYEQFVLYAMKNQDNPFLPKFKSRIRTLPRAFSIEDFDAPVQKAKYVKMELLQPFKGAAVIPMFKDPEIIAHIDKFISNLDPDFESVEIGNDVPLEDIFDHTATLFHPNDDKHNISVVLDMLCHGKYGTEFPYERFISKIDQQFLLFLRTIGAIADLVDVEFDYGKRNFALRGQQLVILDPVCNDADLEFNYEMLGLGDLPVNQI